jgi:hypothetical protein
MIEGVKKSSNILHLARTHTAQHIVILSCSLRCRHNNRVIENGLCLRAWRHIDSGMSSSSAEEARLLEIVKACRETQVDVAHLIDSEVL